MIESGCCRRCIYNLLLKWHSESTEIKGGMKMIKRLFKETLYRKGRRGKQSGNKNDDLYKVVANKHIM